MRTRFLSAVALSGLVAAAPPPPVAVPGGVTDTIQGVRIADPYRALEDPKAPATIAWLAGQNAASRAYFDALPTRRPLYDWIMSVEKTTPIYDGGLRVAGGRMFVMTIRPDKQQPLLSTVTFAGDTVVRRTILDPNALSAKGDTAIDWFEPSPDGRLVAVSLSQGGSEDGTLHVYEVDTGKEVEAPIAHVQFPTAGGSLAWGPDSKSYWYTRYPESGPETERHFNQGAFHHVIGRPAAQDTVVLAAKDGVPRTGEIFLTNPNDGTQALASVQLGDGGEWQHFVLTATGATKVAAYEDKIAFVTIGPKGELYGVGHKDAPNGIIVRRDPGAAAWRTIVPEGRTAIVTSAGTRALAISGDRLFALAIDGGPTRLLAYTLAGQPVAVDTPPVSNLTGLEPDGKGGLFYRLRSYTTPAATLHWVAGAAKATPTPLRVSSPLDFSDIAVTRVFATSKDGTKVPISVMMKKGTKPTGATPTLLYGYGGYGINLSPFFLGAQQRVFFDAGGIYAIANIRGGGEYGERWHSQGMLTAKQTVFDDFTACARWLIDNRWTAPAKLALMGGSNGGLLMGAVTTQHPDLARAVVSEVGIYDMLRVELDPNGAFNIAEFGTVKDPAQFKALYDYSPYHQVVKGTRYPAMLLTTGDNDGRVNPLHSRKFVAAMQAATASGPPIYLRTTANAGHGMGSSLDVQVSETADETAFLFDQLGMQWTPPKR